MMKRIPLTQGKFAIVDDEDYEWLNQQKWLAHAYVKSATKIYWYAQRGIRFCGNLKTISMSRVIMNAPDNLVVDHINHNTLDNRRKNLRICTVKENTRNRFSHNNSQSKFKGVSWHKRICRWQAQILEESIGYFQSEIKAANAYDKKAKELFGEFAYLNFPER